MSLRFESLSTLTTWRNEVSCERYERSYDIHDARVQPFLSRVQDEPQTDESSNDFTNALKEFK